MKPFLFVVAVFFSAAGHVFSDPPDKEFIALMNKVEVRAAGGDVKALDELTTLPGAWATPGLLTIFKNHNTYGATASDKAVAARAAQLAVTTPGSDEYLAKLLKGKLANNYVYFQQESAIKCLVAVHNDISVRILGGALGDVDQEEIGPKVTRALASLNLPGGPVSPKDKVSDSDALSRWKRWWEAHKGNYVKTGPVSPIP